MRARLVGPVLWLYGRVQRSGLLDHPLARRAFESVYLAYKRIEAGPVKGLRPYVGPGSTVVDVGANIGFFALRFGGWVGRTGRVVAIEPEARNVEALRRRIAKAGLGEVVECVEAVAAAEPGELRLALNPVHPGDHHIADEGEPVTAVTVDGLVAGDGRPVSLLKIDVQGAEMLVLDGARAVIERDRPAIFIEVDDEALTRMGASAGELIRRLDDLGYRGHLLTKQGVGGAEAPETLVERSADAYIDVLFLP